VFLYACGLIGLCIFIYYWCVLSLKIQLSREFGVPLIGLNQPHFCVCRKLGHAYIDICHGCFSIEWFEVRSNYMYSFC
jgi:hypothetical protein